MSTKSLHGVCSLTKATLGLLLLCVSLAGVAADTAVVRRATTAHTLPSSGSKVVFDLVENSSVTVLKRAGLWFQVTPIEGEQGKGWVRFSRLRMSGKKQAATTQTESSGGLTRLARSATGLFGYSARDTSAGQSTATLGIRGLSASDLKVSTPDQQAQQKMEAFRATAAQAKAFAGAASLAPQKVAYLKAAGGSSSGAQTGGAGTTGVTGRSD